MNDPWTWSMVWESTVGAEGGLGKGGKGEKIGKTNRIIMKMF